MLCYSKDVIVSGGWALIHQSHALKLSLTVSGSGLLSHWGHPATQGWNNHPVYSQVTCQIYFALIGTVNLYLQCPVSVLSDLMLFLFLCQRHKLLTRMKPKCS